MEATADPDTLRRLRWRCRRGLLENDLFVERFFLRHGDQLSAEVVRGLLTLMDLSDPELLDLLLERREPAPEWTTPEACRVLQMMRTPKVHEPAGP